MRTSNKKEMWSTRSKVDGPLGQVAPSGEYTEDPEDPDNDPEPVLNVDVSLFM